MEKQLIQKTSNINTLILQVSSFVAVIVIFHVCYGLKTLLPENINWLMSANHDWGTHYLGWHFFKNEPWKFPLGDITNYFYPLGTNVGFTDSIPLLAIFFKVFAPILPEDFQYFGIWLFLCHLLTAYYTIRLLNLFQVKKSFIFFVVIFIAANPVLVFRGLHPALCAHWLLIGSLYSYFLNPRVTPALKILFHQAILLILSGLINPYLCFMVLGFSIMLGLKFWLVDKVLKTRSLLIYLAASFISIVLPWYLIGMISFGKKEDLGVQGGFGLYGMNLNSFYNPTGYSAFLPSFKYVSWHQYEGFMYLGLGGILLVITAITCAFIAKKYPSTGSEKNAQLRRKEIAPLFVLMLLYSLFAVSHIITLNENVLLRIPMPDLVVKLGEIFRASSRFFWTVYYLIILFAFIEIFRSKINELLKYAIVVSIAIVQFLDTRPLLHSRNLAYGAYVPPIDNKNWAHIAKEFEEIAFYPPFEASNLASMDYQYFCYLAAKLKKRINTGYVARFDNRASRLYADSLSQQIAEGKLSPGTLYITTGKNLDQFKFAVQSGLCSLNVLDGYYYTFHKSAEPKNLSTLIQVLNKNRQSPDSAVKVLSKKNFFVQIPLISNVENKIVVLSVDKLRDEANYIAVSGWSFLDTSQNNKGDSIFLFLQNDKRSYIAYTNRFDRPDLTSFYQREYLNNAGFNALIFKDNVENGTYKLGVAVKNIHGAMAYNLSSHLINIGTPGYLAAKKVASLPPAKNFNYGIDNLRVDIDFILVSGWAALLDQDMTGCEISIIFKQGDQVFLAPTHPTLRPDVTAAIAKNKYNLDNAGFNARILKSSLPKGKFQLGVLVKDSTANTQSFRLVNHEIEIK